MTYLPFALMCLFALSVYVLPRKPKARSRRRS
jgi:hypothetical protein